MPVAVTCWWPTAVGTTAVVTSAGWVWSGAGFVPVAGAAGGFSAVVRGFWWLSVVVWAGQQCPVAVTYRWLVVAGGGLAEVGPVVVLAGRFVVAARISSGVCVAGW